MTKNSLFIDGIWKEASGETFTSEDPFSGEILWEGRSATPEDINKALQAARCAQRLWAGFSVKKRMGYIEAFAREVEKQKDHLARLISQETGKPLWESLTEVAATVNKAAISVKAYKERCREFRGIAGSVKRYTRFKPKGVIGVFGPFNLPLHLPNGHISPALLAGNTIVYKPSEMTPAVGEAMMKAWEEVRLPKGVLNLVQGAASTGEALSKSSIINGIFFTGSLQTGKALHSVLAGFPEKILALEMGGNNPLVLGTIRDISSAVISIIQSAFVTAGERCVCARRLIVPSTIGAEKCLETLIAAVRKIRVGPYTMKPEPFMGPVISQKAATKLLEKQKILKAMGGRALCELQSLNQRGTLLGPGIMDVTEVKNRMDEELFGPFLQVIRVKDFDGALLEANNTVFGLSAGLLSDNPRDYKRFWRDIDAGIINWNKPMTGASSMSPFGGTGSSGNHRPSAFFAADYCAYPVASLEDNKLHAPELVPPGLEEL